MQSDVCLGQVLSFPLTAQGSLGEGFCFDRTWGERVRAPVLSKPRWMKAAAVPGLKCSQDQAVVLLRSF